MSIGRDTNGTLIPNSNTQASKIGRHPTRSKKQPGDAGGVAPMNSIVPSRVMARAASLARVRRAVVEAGPSQSRPKRRPKLNPAAAAAVTLGLAWAGAATSNDQASGTRATPPAAGAPAIPATPAAPAAPAANPMPFPAMSATLAANGAPA